MLEVEPADLKPPAPLYPLQDFKALYKYCIIIILLSAPEVAETPSRPKNLRR